MTRLAGRAHEHAVPSSAAADKAAVVRLRLEELLGPVEEWSAGLVEALILSFLSRAADYLTTLADALQRQDLEAVTRDSHSLKGMASNLGAVELAALSEALETSGRVGDLASAPSLLTRLNGELDAVRPAMQAVLALTR